MRLTKNYSPRITHLNRAARRRLERQLDKESAKIKAAAPVGPKEPTVVTKNGRVQIVEKPKPWWVKLLFWRKK